MSFSSSFDHAPNPHLEEVLAMEGEREEAEESGRSHTEGEMTLLHLMDEDDDD